LDLLGLGGLLGRLVDFQIVDSVHPGLFLRKNRRNVKLRQLRYVLITS
jgi:hypothetical protein